MSDSDSKEKKDRKRSRGSSRKRSESTSDTNNASSSSNSSFVRTLFYEPSKLVLEILNAFDAWRASREWKRMLWFLPAFLLLAICGSAVLWGSLRSKGELLNRYVHLAETEFPVGGADSEEPKPENEEEAAKQEASRNQYSELIHRRILQLESNNQMARYYVANRMAKSGNRPQARTMMRDLAPDRSLGYPPAHAWTVFDMKDRVRDGEQFELIVWAHHIEAASTWDKCPPAILRDHAMFLKEKGNIDASLKVLRRIIATNPEIRLTIADLAKKSGLESQMQLALDEAIEYYKGRLDIQDEKDEDRYWLSQVYFFQNEISKGKKLLETGIEKNPNRPLLRHGMAEILVKEYRATIRQTENGVEPNINLLNSAALFEPGNKEVGEEIAQLVAIGGKADSSTMKALMDQLGNGQASAVTHLIVANYYVQQKKMKEAISHWELTLAKNPNMILALNNLSVSLTRIDVPDFSRAQELIDRAILLGGEDPELLDSKGTILEAAGKRFAAIAEYEKAIQKQPNRIATREKIVRAYEAEGMSSEAEIQRQAIEKVKKKIEELQALESAKEVNPK